MATVTVEFADTTNGATFTETTYNADNNTLKISGLAKIENGLNFNLSLLTYSDGETTAVEHVLAGNYSIVTSASDAVVAGDYLYALQAVR